MNNGGRGYGVGFNRSLRFQVFPVFTLMRMRALVEFAITYLLSLSPHGSLNNLGLIQLHLTAPLHL